MSNSTSVEKPQGDSAGAARMREAIHAVVTTAIEPINQQLQALDGIERVIRQLNERAENIEKQSEQTKELILKELGALTKRLDDVDQRCDEVDQRLQLLDGRLHRIDEHLDDVDVQILNAVDASYQAYNVGCGSGISLPFKPIPVRIRTSSISSSRVDIDNNSDNVSDGGRTVVVSPVDPQ
ncbi:hypothetical protein F5I97DRAFT_1831764 [Phlebopus sp. FC_14]|nr:hypothetical protein F5I97DRAFT_1831764 [Phlebopus sp. FC_14]